ncbi:hypothetical protein [Cyclobacterium qasimii]|uniref:Uncharacterized protein n=2 Tax=Cyclobacterium qasimii TaxID=1350429 RepID=S7WKJ3_9BACT|nr:hypothetical protein [Cyclobacterium qasimii]EPR67214.1 hypothetical protein ADICYQ_3769 [Cyclobacterium qasimii M12-11B]GEO21561.1 hypothetical protein CQA01_20950 [Cyclobacterium qasimii]
MLLSRSEKGIVADDELQNEMRLSMINFSDYANRNGMDPEETNKLLLNIKNELNRD